MATVLFVACKPDTITYDAEDLVGKWVSGTEYYRYDASMSNYTLSNDSIVQVNGATWDTGDDVQESEAQPYIWSLDGNQLTLIHIGYMGSRIPKVYTITGLTSNTLSYKDNYSQTFTFTRIQ